MRSRSQCSGAEHHSSHPSYAKSLGSLLEHGLHKLQARHLQKSQCEGYLHHSSQRATDESESSWRSQSASSRPRCARYAARIKAGISAEDAGSRRASMTTCTTNEYADAMPAPAEAGRALAASRVASSRRFFQMFVCPHEGAALY